MIRADWDEWKACAGQAKKSRLMAKMVRENESLVQRFASAFIARTQYAVENIRDDIFQAARIGLMVAIIKWNPARAAFSTLAFFEMRHEMQLVLRHATPISRPKDADLPRNKQDAMAAFYAQHGREPEPFEVGVAPSALLRAQAAMATFEPIDVRSQQYDAPSKRHTSSVPPIMLATVPDAPEDAIDRARDMKALRTWARKLTAPERKEFWGGKRPDLTRAATDYVERRRVIR
jgi:DNA-directed RNA polymerase specialized sigma subunit